MDSRQTSLEKTYEKPERDEVPSAGRAYEKPEWDDFPSAGDPGEKPSHEEWLKQDLFQRLAQSPFRSRFRLKVADKDYVRNKGMDVIRTHAEDLIRKRLAPAVIPNDGKQTPMRGHPVFIGQHATATCCRGCLEKWHGIPKGRELTPEEQNYVVDVLIKWIGRQMP